jgi:hypothetical protein
MVGVPSTCKARQEITDSCTKLIHTAASKPSKTYYDSLRTLRSPDRPGLEKTLALRSRRARLFQGLSKCTHPEYHLRGSHDGVPGKLVGKSSHPNKAQVRILLETSS